MASIDRRALAAYRQTLDRVCAGAGSAVTDALGEWLAANPGASIAEIREAAIALTDAVLGTYGDAASTLACDLFDSIMELEGVGLPAAQVYGGVREDAVEGTVRRIVGDVDDTQESRDTFMKAVGQLAERETRLAANTTIEENVERAAKTRAGRNVRYARVPTRAVPCEWCAMLASRGFVYRSAEKAEAASHHHCTCTIVPGIKGVTQVAGYDTAHYANVWQHLDKIGRTEAEPIRTIKVGRSVGARALNDYVVNIPGMDDSHFFPDSEIEVTVVFAGAGSNPPKELRVRNRLAEMYGGEPDDWSHVAGQGWIFDPADGKIRRAEVHWMENPEVGLHEFYWKRWIDPK